ncbi:2-phospho-L-lactate guanylyltransferase [Amphritea sp. 1_MG-2023]|uniref:2-phospho-L-lactate guanylyltransferase n=1 Tax=Amphritea sp. 1_MG-2023 TaxID=3062670 RepID=UPI0026E32BCB|nr:2-phospho-L-lactate guanylyltransferase [Amphritea sp. 1_MG-2023]MDO6564738.1 2-phospho-L-lactate guanylyltransferase [Amphritea sp. 1_MG-2023]
MTLSIVIPMKSPERSKSRLAEVLSRSQRKKLTLELFEKNLGFFRQRYPQHNLLVVTESKRIQDISHSYGAEVLLEEQKLAGLNAAVTLAAEYNVRRGIETQLVIPGDIETLDYQEIECLLSHREARPSVVVCPSYDGGTNAIMTSPPNAMPFSFGLNSCQIHLLSAFNAGLHTQRLFLESLSFDVDCPDDLDRANIWLEKKSA